MPTKEEIAQNNEAWERYRAEHGLAETLNAHGQQLKASILADVEAKYRREMGQRDFWSAFYTLNPDLKQDREFVSKTLDANLNDLADIPVDDAYDKLADLARNELAAGDKRRQTQKEYGMYSGGPGLPDGVVNTPPSGQSSASLGDIIRSRKEKRRNASQYEGVGNRYNTE